MSEQIAPTIINIIEITINLSCRATDKNRLAKKNDRLFIAAYLSPLIYLKPA